MPEEYSPAVLVARFLRSNHYTETLDAFLKEAGLPSNTGASSGDALTIETVLQEKKVFDLSQSFEKTSVEDEEKGWSTPAPSSPSIVQTLPIASNILHTTLTHLTSPSINEFPPATTPLPFILATTADRSIHILSASSPFPLTAPTIPANDSPTLTTATLHDRYLLTATMSSLLVLRDTHLATTLATRRDHSKYVVQLACQPDPSGAWVATAGWDSKVHLYRLSLPPTATTASSTSRPTLSPPIATLTLPTLPESILFIPHRDINTHATPVLLLSRRDSTSLHYYTLPTLGTTAGPNGKAPPTLHLLGTQNLAPHSNAWIAFTPAALALHPADPVLLAVGTSHLPHMKLIVVRLLLPPPPPPLTVPGAVSGDGTGTGTGTLASDDATRAPAPPQTQAQQARAQLARQDREAAAILTQACTFAPQTAYSTAAVAWRADGSGVWVNGEDGVVRGVEWRTGRVVAVLKGGHEEGARVRCLWAGRVGKGGQGGGDGWVGGDVEEDGEEVVVSGGFDRRLVVWRVSEGDGEGRDREING